MVLTAPETARNVFTRTPNGAGKPMSFPASSGTESLAEKQTIPLVGPCLDGLGLNPSPERIVSIEFVWSGRVQTRPDGAKHSI